MINFRRYYFTIGVSLITFIGFSVRYFNINYSSLWSDELYTILSVHPDNSWYEILYLQKGHQAPLYFVILKIWTLLFSYNEFYARLLPIIGGVFGIVAIALLGKLIKNEKLGLIMAVLVAFNPMLIYYSLENRPYSFCFLFAVLSLMLHFIINKKKSGSFLFFFIKSVVDVSLWLLHHFGIFLIFTEFVFDVILYIREKDRRLFVRKLISYFITGLLYAPWFLFGFLDSVKMSSYWLKETDILNYLLHSLSFSAPVDIICILLILFSLYNVFKNRRKEYYIYFFIIVFVTLIPVLYSYVRMPILVDRYGIVMAPAFYIFLSLGMLEFISFFKKEQFRKTLIGFFFLMIMIPGINLSFFDKKRLDKAPWREMGNWINSHPEIGNAKFYSNGMYIKKQMGINFYIGKDTKVDHLNYLKIKKDSLVCLIEANGPWKISDSIINKIYQTYEVDRKDFKSPNSVILGHLYICKLK